MYQIKADKSKGWRTIKNLRAINFRKMLGWFSNIFKLQAKQEDKEFKGIIGVHLLAWKKSDDFHAC